MITSAFPGFFHRLLIIVFWIPLQIYGQDVARFNFRPYVIRSDRDESVLFEALVTGAPTKVAFEYDGIDRPMRDDGLGSDSVAGDSIYTLAFQASEITGKLTDSDVYRPFIGFCKPFQGENLIGRFNIFAEVWTDEIPLVSVEQLDTDFQVSPNLVNIKGQVPLGGFDARPWTNRFYEFFDDDYDFLNIIIIPALRGNRYHFAVKNTTDGLGLTQFDNSSQYGSAGKLQGITIFPISYFFDGAESGYQHELGHQWINFLHGTPFEVGIPHWPLSDVASGVMGRSIPGTNAGGRFPYKLIQEGENYRVESLQGEPVFNDLELYLMGLLEPDSVGNHFVFEDQNQTPQDGLLMGPVTHVTIEDLISILGPRDPDYSISQKSFRIATIIISEDLLSLEAMSFFNYFAQRAELKEEVIFSSGFLKSIAKPFFISTGGRGELDTHIGEQPTFVAEQPIYSPSDFSLAQNYPNPFNPTTTIEFSLPADTRVTLSVYNILGEKVATLVDDKLPSGIHSIQWHTKEFSSGVYFYQLRAGNLVQTRKLNLLK